MASPNMLATTFTYKAERFQTFKYTLSWLAMLFSTFIFLPLVSFGALPVSIAAGLIFFLMIG
jgi:hypothetical protein